jgi:hypothetical protein
MKHKCKTYISRLIRDIMLKIQEGKERMWREKNWWFAYQTIYIYRDFSLNILWISKRCPYFLQNLESGEKYKNIISCDRLPISSLDHVDPDYLLPIIIKKDLKIPRRIKAALGRVDIWIRSHTGHSTIVVREFFCFCFCFLGKQL